MRERQVSLLVISNLFEIVLKPNNTQRVRLVSLQIPLSLLPFNVSNHCDCSCFFCVFHKKAATISENQAENLHTLKHIYRLAQTSNLSTQLNSSTVDLTGNLKVRNNGSQGIDMPRQQLLFA